MPEAVALIGIRVCTRRRWILIPVIPMATGITWHKNQWIVTFFLIYHYTRWVPDGYHINKKKLHEHFEKVKTLIFAILFW
jgi:hypothetical protein